MNFKSLGTPPVRPQPPFLAFNNNIIQIIEQAICAAWTLLQTSKKLDLSVASEKAITAELQEAIIDVMNDGNIKGFTPDIFSQPTRDASVSDFSGNFLEKKPDLTFSIQNAKPLSVHKGVFFECKPVGSLSVYFGENGLGRFCDGRYAWAMPHAGMIGYVQRKKAINAKDAIESQINSGSLIVSDSYGDKGAAYNPIWVSVHDRNFSLPNGNAPGQIHIRHLWLLP